MKDKDKDTNTSPIKGSGPGPAEQAARKIRMAVNAGRRGR